MNKEMIINKLKEKKDIFLLIQKLKNLSEVEKININKSDWLNWQRNKDFPSIHLLEENTFLMNAIRLW